ncbi:hypothetical protein H0H87_011957 [Tephrocybe sp. NHM501043]|nr:hypothetical protein H0H87_011957 [Tephrocybe sp. NHM501043]
MLTLLHDDKYGFGLEMTQYDTWKNLFRFPTTVDLSSRSSWTIGAAALIARHGELSLCPTGELPGSTVQVNTLDASISPNPLLPVASASEAACELAPEPITANTHVPMMSLYNIVAYTLVFLLLTVVGYQRRQLRASRSLRMSDKGVSLA